MVQWAMRGATRAVNGRELFVVDINPEAGDPIVFLHGFPSCSFDWRHVIDDIAGGRRAVLLDFLGYGLSDKPADHRYSLFEQADLTCTLLDELGVNEFALGGEILARINEGSWDARVTARAITNGSIYMEHVQLSPGQELLLQLPDEALPDDELLNEELFKPALAATFGPHTQPGDDELQAQWVLLSRLNGNRLLPRLIRYIGERHQHEPRWTGAIESHPSPLHIIWGEVDPIAVLTMAETLAKARPDATLTVLDGIGHYPMIEAPDRFAAAARQALS